MSEPAVPLVLSRITIATTSHQYGKTNLSHDGLNPALVPYWRVNHPTLGEFCFAMIVGADIEGSKSDVATPGRHKPVIPVVISLTPLAENSSCQKEIDRPFFRSLYAY